jgi:hypothetical protein
VPHVERAGEAEIARDAAALREKAVDRLAQLTRQAAVRPTDGNERRAGIVDGRRGWSEGQPPIGIDRKGDTDS